MGSSTISTTAEAVDGAIGFPWVPSYLHPCNGPPLLSYLMMIGSSDGMMIISVIVTMLTNYLGMPLIYLKAASFFPESEGVNVNANLRVL